MEQTSQYRVVLAAAGGGAVFAVLFSNQLLFGIPIGIGTWLLAHQLAVVRSVQRIRRTDTKIVSQSLADESIQAGDSTTLHVRIADEHRAMAGFDGLLELMIPPELVADSAQTRRLPEADTMDFEVPLRAPTAGSFEIEPPTIQFSSSHGLFRGTLRVGNACSLVVDPRVPNPIQADSDQRHSDAVPSQRESPTDGSTDTVRRADSPTHLYIDRRANMSDGRPGETKLDYARDIGLGFTAHTADTEASIQLSFINHDQVSNGASMSLGSEHYDRVRRRLHDLAPESGTAIAGDTDEHVDIDGQAEHDSLSVRRDALHRAKALGRNETFDRTLAPHFETMATYHKQLANDPLISSVTTTIREDGIDREFVIVTDDSSRAELLGTAQLASVHDAELSLFVLPSVFFADRTPTEVDGIAEEYNDFQTLISELNETDGVTAFEAGPHSQSSRRNSQPTQRVRS